MLERKIDRHMREHANEMKTFRNELHILKMKPTATKDQRTLNDGNKKPAHNLKAELARNKITSAKPLKKIHNDHGKSTNNYSAPAAGGDKMSNNNVNKTVSAKKEILPSNSSHTSTLSLSLTLCIESATSSSSSKRR